MVDGTRVASIASLTLAVLLFFWGIKRKMDYQRYNKLLMHLSGLFVVIATLLESFKKGSSLKVRDILDIIIVLVSVVLLFIAASKDWGMLASTLIVSIGLLTSVQFLLND